jgi:aldehyde:ferredoxin oxidoreductase
MIGKGGCHMSNAFIGQILRVNLTSGVVSTETLNPQWARHTLGGAGLATRYLFELTSPGIDPLGAENVLIFMTGALTGTPSASASRYSVVAKSPQTNLWGQSNSGGFFGPALKWSGFDGVIFEGVSPEPVYLWIRDGEAELRNASHLWGLTVPESDDRLQSEIGRLATVACIGPGGENLVRYASIMNNKNRAAGRTGMGAVMGSKRLKAIACSGNRHIPIYNSEEFKRVTQRQREFMDESILKITFETFGTNAVADLVNIRGGYPVQNWQSGTFEQIENVNGQAMTDQVLVEGVRCFACPVACGRGTEIRQGKWKGAHGEGPEYETADTLGAMCGVDDLNAITMANYRCNELGLDTISAGATIAFAMECYQRGVLTNEQTGGIALEFGNGDLVVDLIERIGHRNGIGDLLAEGTQRMAEKLGAGSEHYAMHVKGLELPAYDPRAAKITGLGYVTANRGGDHMNGYIQAPTFIDIPFMIVDNSMIRDPLVANPEDARVLIDMENALSVLDALGGCKFMGILLSANEIVDLVRAATGWDFDLDEFRKCGDRLQTMARAFCNREGLRRDHDILPERLMEDPLPDGPAQGMVLDRSSLEKLKDAYYELREWDIATGVPTPAKLHELDLDYLIPQLWDR